VIGAGRIGRVHLETLASVPGVKPVILSDVVEPVLKEVTETYGVPKYTLNADEVINNPEVEAVRARRHVPGAAYAPSESRGCRVGLTGVPRSWTFTGVDLLAVAVPR
jgi:hypothetical protein